MNEILVIISIIFLLFILSNNVNFEGLDSNKYTKDGQSSYSAVYGSNNTNSTNTPNLGNYNPVPLSDDNQGTDYLSNNQSLISSHQNLSNQNTVSDLLHLILYDK
jgi:hypothetical protein